MYSLVVSRRGIPGPPLYLLSLDLLGGEGALLVDVQALGPQGAVPALGGGGAGPLAAGSQVHPWRLAGHGLKRKT